ncbi:hypothetical protein [Bacillus alkalicellulosilyticus]|uniref:hypothetical protein n=1 Tax=Alkalihalobacterium alkalicellulosilyticum TaxID=1912214 RepID=UPI0011169442|nr:hypothetical protein [Bacillus alkalicellulosilyticus]
MNYYSHYPMYTRNDYDQRLFPGAAGGAFPFLAGGLAGLAAGPLLFGGGLGGGGFGGAPAHPGFGPRPGFGGPRPGFGGGYPPFPGHGFGPGAPQQHHPGYGWGQPGFGPGAW